MSCTKMSSIKDEELDGSKKKSPPTSLNWMALAGLCISFAVGQGLFRLDGLLYVELLDLFSQGPVRTSFVMSLSYLMGAISGPILGVVCKTTSPRAIMMTLGLCGAGAYLLAAFVSRFEVFTFIYGILIGLFINITANSQLVLVGKMDAKWRTFATAMVTTSGSVGAVVMAQIFSMATETYALRGALIILAGISLQVALTGAMQPRSTGEKSTLKQQYNNKTERNCYGIVQDSRVIENMATSKGTGLFIIPLPGEKEGEHSVSKIHEKSELRASQLAYLNDGFQSPTNFLTMQMENTLMKIQGVVEDCGQNRVQQNMLHFKEKSQSGNERIKVQLPVQMTWLCNSRITNTFCIWILPILKNIKYLRLLVFALLQGTSMAISITAAVTYAAELGATPSQRSLLVTIANVTGACGRFIVGYFLFKLVEKKERILAVLTALNASVSFMLYYTPSAPCMYIFFVVSGLYADSMCVFHGYQVFSSVGLEFFELGLGIVIGLYYVAILIGNLLIGAVIEATGSSRMLILINALCNLVAIAILMTTEVKVTRLKFRKRNLYYVNGPMVDGHG